MSSRCPSPQLLDELSDNGIAMITEPNALHSLIAPPSVGRRMLEFVTGKSRVSETIGAAAMSVIPWRKAVRSDVCSSAPSVVVAGSANCVDLMWTSCVSWRYRTSNTSRTKCSLTFMRTLTV
jgi:hypothetical protein